MKKKSAAGARHYRQSGLKPILVYVDTKLHARLVKQAKREGRSLQVAVRRILEGRDRKKA